MSAADEFSVFERMQSVPPHPFRWTIEDELCLNVSRDGVLCILDRGHWGKNNKYLHHSSIYQSKTGLWEHRALIVNFDAVGTVCLQHQAIWCACTVSHPGPNCSPEIGRHVVLPPRVFKPRPSR